ncbi:MAG TPA: hypothetical protein VIM41_06210 [Gammaproteobacteria bacterium]
MKIISGVIFFAVIVLAIGLLIPAGEHSPDQTFPWQVEHTADGGTRVFGLILGESTVQDAEQVFNAAAEISLFEPPDNQHPQVIEAYFDKVTLGGLSAKVVIVMDIAPQHLMAIYQRGARISTLGDGSRKVTLHMDDIQQVRSAPIGGLTYLPRIRLDAALLEKRFGKPAQIVIEKDSNTTHWLYPDKGLDVSLDEHGNGVLQYVPPAKFAQLMAPLDLL